MITVYNTLTRKQEPFVPSKPREVGMYVCGITVYDDCHLGHARSNVVFDVVVRFLRFEGFKVRYVRNITDIDDKIIARAHERGIGIEVLTDTCIKAMHDDFAALYLLPPDSEPRATAHIPGIIRLIERLFERNLAYVSDNGDVCYEVARFEGYGKLSNKDLEGLEAGARIGLVREKRSPLDFVLWKRSKPGEPAWESPWGDGRPGWHIECSAMAMDSLGETFDIHGGGLDLQFPHHENEIAQSEGATGVTFARYWLHAGMLQVNHEKMSKSLGNFYTIKDVLVKHHPEVVRYFLLSNHYRSPLNYTEDNLLMAHKGLTRLYQTLRYLDGLEHSPDTEWVERFRAAMQDDFNAPVALSVLFDLSHAINKTEDAKLAFTLKYLGGVLGLFNESAESFLRNGVGEEGAQAIETLIAERTAARQNKDWARADAIRQQLVADGIEIEDGVNGTTWRRKI